MTPRAAPPVFPFPGHRTLAELDRDERLQRNRAPGRTHPKKPEAA